MATKDKEVRDITPRGKGGSGKSGGSRDAVVGRVKGSMRTTSSDRVKMTPDS